MASPVPFSSVKKVKELKTQTPLQESPAEDPSCHETIEEEDVVPARPSPVAFASPPESPAAPMLSSRKSLPPSRQTEPEVTEPEVTEVPKEPEAPELSCYEELLNTDTDSVMEGASKALGERVAAPPTPDPVCPKSASRSVAKSFVEQASPAPPSFSARSMSILSSKQVSPEPMIQAEVAMDVEEQVEEMQQLAPPIREVTAEAIFTPVSCVSAEEYEAVPQYLRTQFSLSSLNEAVAAINRLVGTKAVESLKEEELKNDLQYGIRAQALLLLLKSCGRMTKSKDKATGEVTWLVKK